MKLKYHFLILLFLISLKGFSQFNAGFTVTVTSAGDVCPGEATQLTATFDQPQRTTSYGVSQPPAGTFPTTFPTVNGTTVGGVGQDDIFSPVINLPFDFSFYGVTYDKIIVGTNGVVSFDISQAGLYCPWSFSGSIPSTTFPIRNAIYGVYQDTDLSQGALDADGSANNYLQTVNYYILDAGDNVAPNRVFVANWNQLPQFGQTGCPTAGLQTSQIIIHESSNTIDILVHDRKCCPSWQGGAGVIGVQNAAGTLASVAMQTGCYELHDQAFIITPNGGPSPTPPVVNWTTPAGPVGAVDENPLLNVAVITPTPYTATVTYTNLDGTTFNIDGDITVSPLDAFPGFAAVEVPVCGPETNTYSVNIDQGAAFSAGAPSTNTYDFSYYTNQTAAENGAAGFIPTTSWSTYQVTGPFPVTLYARVESIDTGCTFVYPLNIVNNVPVGDIVYNATYCQGLTSGTVSPDPTLGLSPGGTFSAVPITPNTGTLSINTNTGTINPSLSGLGSYTVEYYIPASGTCAAFYAYADLEIVDCPCTPVISAAVTDLCVGDSLPTSGITFSTPGATAANLTSGPLPAGLTGTFSLADETYTITGTPPAVETTTPYTITVDLITAVGNCSGSASINVGAIPTISGVLTACAGATTQLTGSGTPASTNPWSSSNSLNATVSDTGLVTGIIAGQTADITYTTAAGCTETVTVTISAAPVITGTTTVCEGLTTQLTGSALPSTTTPAWTSSDITKVTVSNTGLVTAIASGGSPTITYTNSLGCTVSTPITVYEKPAVSGTLEVCVGLTTQLADASVTPTAGTWTSLTPLLATVDGNGLVTGISAGPALIRYTSGNGCDSDDVSINVEALPTISGPLEVCEGSQITLIGSGTPATSGAWTSLDTAAATVDNFGVVTGIAAPVGGFVTITYKVAGGCSISEDILINPLPIITGTLNVCQGQTSATPLASTATPAAGNPWRSLDPTIATVDAAGFVTSTGLALPVSIEYTDDNGCSSSVIYNVLATPTVTTTGDLNPVVCVNSPITPIVFTFGGSATGLVAPALPAGFSLTSSGSNTYTLTGTPTTTASFSITVATDGGCSPAATLTVNGTVNPIATIAITSTSGSSTQTVCKAVAIDPITYVIGDGATSAILTNGAFPAGITGNFDTATGVYTISGASSVAGATFDYEISTVGGCPVNSVTGTIIISADINPTLDSPAATANQLNACLNEPINPIVYLLGPGATFDTATNLPAGVTATVTGTTVTISGQPTAVGIGDYNYTIVFSGCGGPVTLSGRIVVVPDATIVLASGPISQTQCINSPIDDLTYTLGNGATFATVSAGSLPPGVSLTVTGTSVLLSGIATEAGVYNFTLETSGGCSTALTSGQITIQELPVVNLAQDGFICLDTDGNVATDYTLTTNLSETDYTFVWLDPAGAIIAGATGSSYTVTVPGNYTVEVTENILGCYNTANATVVPSYAPQLIVTSVSNYFADDNTVIVTVSPVGNYEYSLDNGAFQSSNQFHDLMAGDHIVVVQDVIGCGSLPSLPFRIIDFPRYFTPNGDGYNDFWNIPDLSDQNDSKIFIFDRYGKLIKEISPKGKGWDGNYNGHQLPGDDFWFEVHYTEDGIARTHKAHFSIKR